MPRLEPVVRLSGNRLAIAYPGERGVKVVQIQPDNSPQELFDLTPVQLKQMADAAWLPEGISFDEGLAIVLTWTTTVG
jgi:hypothetical protein